MSWDDALLRDYMHGFYGYGSYECPCWFVGMEEGSTGAAHEITRRIRVWGKRGRPELDDLVDFHRETGLDPWFQPHAKRCPTWWGLIRLLLAAEGIHPTVEQVRSFQRAELGRIGGTNALIELFPLPSKSLKDWLYADHSTSHCLRNRNTYYREMQASRIQHLRECIREHRPRAVICYGLGHRQRFEQIAGPFVPAGLPDLQFASCGDTLIALVPHTSQGRGSSIQFLEKAGEIIAARQKGVRGPSCS